ncbi:MAG TPA: alpha/beta hydrolase [Jiangellaceae bacterium]
MSLRSPTRYRTDIPTARRRLTALAPATIDTPPGRISYVDQGVGFPLLLVHGVFGGYDAGLRLIDPEVRAGYRCISPSRFGYPGTPMPPNPTVQLQADAHAALLDALGIDQVAVAAGSAGVTSALQMAIRHPSRVAALVLVSSNVPGPHHRRGPFPRSLAQRLWGSNLLMWLIRTYLSTVIVNNMMGIPKDLPLTEADRARLDEELDAIFPVFERVQGAVFDGFTGNADINTGYPLHTIGAPTLLVHYKDDAGPPYAGAVALADAIPGARLLGIDHGGHLGLGNHREVPSEIAAFLRETVE